MYSPDLAPYTYGLPAALPDVLAIGWLSAEQSFPTGDPGGDMLLRIERLLCSNRVNAVRGFHFCELCRAQEPIKVTITGGSLLLGAAEIWLPSAEESVVFAAPDLLFHYVAAHKYRPPPPFLEAVAVAHTHPSWNPELECERRLERAFAK